MSESTTLETVGTPTTPWRRIRVVPVERCEPWLRDAIESLDRQSRFAHPYQTEAFAAFSNTDPSRPPYVIVAEDEKGLAAHWWGHFVRYREKPWPRSAAWSRSGPVLRPDLAASQGDLTSDMLVALKTHARRQRVGWIIVTSEALYGSLLENTCLAEGFSRRDLATFVIDLSPSVEELWQHIDPRVRWSINKSRKLGVAIEEAASDDDIRSYYDLDVEMASVAGESHPPRAHYVEGCRRLLESSQGLLLLAKHDGRTVAGSLLLYHRGFAADHQHAIYPEGRRLRAGDLLLWHSIVAVKEASCSRYDLVTVEVAPQPGSREEGIRDFKAKWGGSLVETPSYRYWSPTLRLWRTLVGRLRR